MGLDTSHDAWHGPYSSFNRWRKDIASQIGIDLDKMYGFGGEIAWPEHPLTPLLYHSDCDGDINWKDCEAIADALEAVLPKITDQWHIEHTKDFIEGARLAHSLKENIDFH